MLLAGSLCCSSGCLGGTSNPSYFPNLVPFGDIIPTHAKPIGPSYYANFDPHAVRLEVRPLEATNPVRTQHVLIATVYDEKGVPRRKRRVEWILEGEGNIIEVDESGCFPGRGYKEGTKYAVSYTNYHEHQVTRGNQNPGDDFTIRPGQTWCVISASREGDTYLTAYAPGVADWDKGRVFVTCHWVDANWAFPPPVTARAGTQQVITTKVFRQTDHQPLANYRVRYTILDGPDAVFLHHHTREVVAVSDLSGNAHATIAEVTPALGVNRIGIEIIRPPDPTAPSGAGIVIARGETSVKWQAPSVLLSHTAPPTAGVEQDVTFTTTVNNNGEIESKSMTVTSQVPDGMQYRSSQPPAFVDGTKLTWALGMLPAGQSHTITTVYRAKRPGPVTSTVTVLTEEGLKDEKSAVVQVTTPGLKVAVTGPAGGAIGVPFTLQIVVTNSGTGPAEAVALNAQFEAGLEHDTKANPLNLPLGTLAGGESKTVGLVLTPRQVGTFKTVITAISGGLKDQTEHVVVVQQPQMTLSVDGPKMRYEGRPADFSFRVGNSGQVPLSNVVVRSRLPAELGYVSAGPNAQLQDNEVVWTVGTLNAGEQKTLQLTTTCKRIAPNVELAGLATADPGVRAETKTTLEIRALPAGLKTSLKDIGDPVAVGKRLTYEIEASNTGTEALKQVQVRAIIPNEMKFTSAGGPSKETVAGQIVTFAPMDVAKDQTLKYTIEVEGVKAGDVRFRVEIRYQGLDPQAPPLVEEESSTVFDPNLPGKQ
jgi:uncharacterized repeat protein (TIGR01451 family)